MVKHSILIIQILVVATHVAAQTYTYSPVNTPKCSTVTAYTGTELPQSVIDSYNADAASQYPNATILASASSTYNCHGYAWHMSDGGSARWIGYLDASHEDVYWGDGSYSQVTSGATSPLATKVSYSADDHSATTTTTSNVLISKWGSWPLMQHAPTYTPYNSSNLKYYRVPITGANLICASPSSTFQSITPSSGSVTYSWSTGSYLSPSSQSGSTNSFAVSATANGNSYINVEISSSCSSTTISGRKSVWVGAPGASASTLIYPSGLRGVDPVTLSPASTYQFYSDAVVNGYPTSWTWILPSGFSFYSGETTSSPQITTTATNGNYTLYCYVNNVCGSSYTKNLGINIGSGGGGDPLRKRGPGNSSELDSPDVNSIETNAYSVPYPNPTSEGIFVLVDEVSTVALSSSHGQEVFSISCSGAINIPVVSLANGIYYLTISNGMGTSRQKVIVQH